MNLLTLHHNFTKLWNDKEPKNCNTVQQLTYNLLHLMLIQWTYNTSIKCDKLNKYWQPTKNLHSSIYCTVIVWMEQWDVSLQKLNGKHCSVQFFANHSLSEAFPGPPLKQTN